MPPVITPLAGRHVAGVADLLAAALPIESVTPEKFARHILLDPNFDPRGACVATFGDDIAGFIYAAARRQPLNDTDARRGYITAIAVAEPHRRQGLGARLLAAAEAFVRSMGRTEVLISPYAPAYFTPGIDLAAYQPAINLFKTKGYDEVTRPVSMRCDLTGLTEPQGVAEARRRLADEGVAIEPFSPAMTRAILDFASSEFGTDWEVVYRETIAQILRGQALTSRIVAALANGDVLGITHHDADRFGPIGVAAAARGRGIGQVLMHATLSAQRAAGHASAYFLWTDDQTAHRLYRPAGFVEARRFVILRKRL